MRGAEYPHVRCWLRQNKLRAVEAWLAESDLNLDRITHFKTKLIYTTHARALIALSREHPGGTHLEDALGLLDELLDLAERNGWGSKVIEIPVLRALALEAGGDAGRAMIALERALALATRGTPRAGKRTPRAGR